MGIAISDLDMVGGTSDIRTFYARHDLMDNFTDGHYFVLGWP